jgi:hypothetical protein
MLNRGFLELVDAAYSEDGAVEAMDARGVDVAADVVVVEAVCDIVDCNRDLILLVWCMVDESCGSIDGGLMVERKVLFGRV